MFQDSGEARYSKTKSVLKNKLQVDVYKLQVRGIQTEAVFTDGAGTLQLCCVLS